MKRKEFLKMKCAPVFPLLLICMLLGACASKSSEDVFYCYHPDADGTALETDEIEISGETAEEITDELIEAIKASDPETFLPEDVEITGYELNGILLTVEFTETYYEMDTIRELMCRAAIVETLLQTDGVNGVLFMVSGEALTDADGIQIGLMTEDTFITNPASQINSTQEATVVLYFTDETGTMLYPEQRTVHYFTSMSVEWMVVKQLIYGPDTEESGLSLTVPAETSIINVTSADGICYVNLDQAFLSTTFTVSAETTVYSIVNSLCELEEIDSVQIQIDGSTDVMYQDLISLNQIFTMNEDLIAGDADPVETEVDAENE